MLVLSRKVGERIIIQDGDHQIVVVVCEIQPGKVRLAFEAPREVGIWREEVLKSKSPKTKE